MQGCGIIIIIISSHSHAGFHPGARHRIEASFHSQLSSFEKRKMTREIISYVETFLYLVCQSSSGTKNNSFCFGSFRSYIFILHLPMMKLIKCERYGLKFIKYDMKSWHDPDVIILNIIIISTFVNSSSHYNFIIIWWHYIDVHVLIRVPVTKYIYQYFNRYMYTTRTCHMTIRLRSFA